MIFFVLTDSTGSVDVIWFPPRQGADTREPFVRGGRSVVVRGFNQVGLEPDTTQLIVEAVEFAPV